MSISAFNLPDKDAGHLEPHPGQDGAEAVSDPFSLNPFYPYPFTSRIRALPAQDYALGRGRASAWGMG